MWYIFWGLLNRGISLHFTFNFLLSNFNIPNPTSLSHKRTLRYLHFLAHSLKKAKAPISNTQTWNTYYFHCVVESGVPTCCSNYFISASMSAGHSLQCFCWLAFSRTLYPQWLDGFITNTTHIFHLFYLLKRFWRVLLWFKGSWQWSWICLKNLRETDYL